MSYAVKIGTSDARWIDNDPTPAGHVRFDGDPTGLVWGEDIQNLRAPTAAEQAVIARAAIRPVSARQMLVALDESGMLDGIEAYVASQPRVVQITWARSQEFQRDNPLLAAGAQAFGLTPEQVDNLFALAATK